MSREEAMNALVESGIELRRDDIELGRKLERERIIKLLEGIAIETKNGEIAVMELLSAIEKLIKGEQK